MWTFQYLIWPLCAAKTAGKCFSWSIPWRNLTRSLSTEQLQLWDVGGFPHMNHMLQVLATFYMRLFILDLQHFYWIKVRTKHLLCSSLIIQLSWGSIHRYFPFTGNILNSLYHQWWQAVLAQMKQNKPKPWYYHHHASLMEEDSYAVFLQT